MSATFADVDEIACDPTRASVYEHGWQSWSPTGRYPATATSPRPLRPALQTMAYRPGKPPPDIGFQGEGLVAVEPGDGTVTVWHTVDPTVEVASIRVQAVNDRLVVSADGPVRSLTSGDGLDAALGGWADRLAAQAGAAPVRPQPPGWCSWYCYWGDVTEDDIVANLDALGRLDLPAQVVQIDDGYQADIGDWLERSPRFGPLDRLCDRIAGSGRRSGLWLAPFMVGAGSRVADGHPDWLVGGAVAAEHHWGAQIRVLDVTHPAAARHLQHVFATLAADGFDYFKLDFLYAGALDGARAGDATGLDAYRHGLRLIRDAVGPHAILLGCGAPLLPSVGLFDAMRISPDVDPFWEPAGGDVSQPSGRSALRTGQARAFMHGRLWANDPDCLIVRPGVEHRQEWAAHVEASGGLAVSSDPVEQLDAWGLETTRRLLRPSRAEPVT